MTEEFRQVSIERVQDYWDGRPCNIRHSTQEIGTREYFDEVEARKYLVEPHIPGFAEFDRWAGKRVLEIGCGIGTDTINFARAGAQVTAVDLSSASLDIARQRAAVFGLSDRIDFFQADAERLHDVVEPAAYDLVYSFGVIHHTPHPERVIKTIREYYTRPGTTLKLMVYNKRSQKVLRILLTSARGAFWRLDEHIARNSEAEENCPVTFSYTKRTIRDLVLPGFNVQDIAADHIFPYRIADYSNYRYVKRLHWRILPKPVFRFLERRIGWHLLVTAEAS